MIVCPSCRSSLTLSRKSDTWEQLKVSFLSTQYSKIHSSYSITYMLCLWLGVLGLLYNWLRIALFKALLTDVFCIRVGSVLGYIPITRGSALDANAIHNLITLVVTVIFKVVHIKPLLGFVT